MNRMRTAGLTGMMIGLTMLAGCAKTPEDSLVKQKGKAAMEQYKEAGTEAAGAEEAQTEAEAVPDAPDVQNQAPGDKDSPAGEAGTAADGSPVEDADGRTAGEAGTAANALRTRLGAPEAYQNETADATGKLKILTDAVVEIPDAEKVPTIAVSQRAFEQELIDRITDTFFGGAVIYDSYGFYQMTKSDWQARLEELKGDWRNMRDAIVSFGVE